jgi:adenylate cyclase
MGQEIERKFLVDFNQLINDRSFQNTLPEKVLQGYLLNSKERNLRVRTIGDKAFLTIKGKQTGLTRAEFEYEIPISDAQQLLIMCGSEMIEKLRYTFDYKDKTWEVDVFEGKNKGLIVAEVELTNENESIELPDWVTNEVSMDPKYTNAVLIHTPFSDWC